MTTTATNSSTAIVCVRRSKATSFFPNRKMIAMFVFILCGATAMSARSLLQQPPVPQPTRLERLQSQWSSLFTPLTTKADRKETKVDLPFLKTTIRMPYPGFLPYLFPEPKSKPTITEEIIAYFETTGQQISPSVHTTYAFFEKTFQQVSSCLTSSIACAIRMKDSVVEPMTTAGDKKKKNNFYSNKDTMMTSSDTACAIRSKDSVVKNCLCFISKLGIYSSETSAGDNNKNHNEEEHEGESTKWRELKQWVFVGSTNLVVIFLFYLDMCRKRGAMEMNRERAAMESEHKLLWMAAMFLWYAVTPMLFLGGLVFGWAVFGELYDGEDTAWTIVGVSSAVCSIVYFLQIQINEIASLYRHRYNADDSEFATLMRIEKLHCEVFSVETLRPRMFYREYDIRDAYKNKHGVDMTEDLFEETLRDWFLTYMSMNCKGVAKWQIKAKAFEYFKKWPTPRTVDYFKEDELRLFDQYVTMQIKLLDPTYIAPETE